VKPAFRVFCAIAAFTLACGALSFAEGQTASPTPDPFVVQLTSTPSATFGNFAGDISGNGRFVVFESNADLATNKTTTRNNADGNREIFLADYAQRRIFQITNTKNVPKPPASPSPTPTPSPSPTASPTPTPTPSPTPADLSQVQIEVSNNRPVISFAPALSGGTRVFTIVFSSNAPNPASFDGVDTGGALAADGNEEIWIYQLPPVADVNLSSGADLPLQDLAAGTFTRITNTPASRVPAPGGPGVPPFVADDNRSATISDTGAVLAFVSTRNLVPATGNADGNPEIFLFNVATSAFTQATITQDVFDASGRLLFTIFNENPSISGDGSVVAFISNGNLVGSNNDDGSGHGNAEVYVVNFSGSAVSNMRQATRTKADATFATINVFSPGRRLSRDGSMLAFETLAEDPKANGPNKPFLAVFVYSIAADSFVQIGLRALSSPGDILHFPTFTDYTGLTPSTLVFASALNFRADGTFPAAAQDSEGLNPGRVSQIFATQIPASSSNTFTRLTNHPSGVSFGGVRPLASGTRGRIAYDFGGTELGGGNPDSSTEVFYLLSPTVTTVAADALSFFTGASNMPVPAASPTPTPTASPTPTPTPTPTPSPSPGAALGLAAGELGIIRASVDLAPSNATATGGSETSRSPALPVELNGVSVSVRGAAAGLYFVGNSPRQINFVVPIGLASGVVSVVVNNNGTVFRGFILLVGAQPDLFTTTNDAGGRAIVRNVTNPLMPTTEPFAVKSTDGGGNLVATVLEISLTGVRNALPAEVKVTIGTTDITPALVVSSNPEMPGFNLINFALPDSLAGAGDVPIVVTITRSAATFSSRPASSAPHITISP